MSARSSARPRYITIGAWVCVLISPGRTICPRASIVSRGRYLAAIASAAPTSTMSAASMATEPGVRICRSAFSVITVPPATTSEIARRGGWPSADAATAAASIAAQSVLMGDRL